VLDRKSFNSLRNLFGGPTSVKFKETLDLFLNSSEVLLKSLRIAMDNHAIDEVRRIGHTLKSSSASFGAIRLAAQCAALEHAARDGRDDEIETLVRTVETEYDLMRTEIHAERDTTTHD
jgi:HPt (histidine-containing phosphotransfer) domain-containing protein